MVTNRISLNGQPSRLNHIVQHIRVLRSYAALVRQHVQDLNSTVSEVHASGILPSTAILGSVLQNRPYDPVPGGSTSGQVVQAALLVPGGMGILIWDSEDFFSLQQQEEGLEFSAWNVFLPWDRCSDAFQGFAATQYHYLVERFVNMFA